MKNIAVLTIAALALLATATAASARDARFVDRGHRGGCCWGSGGIWIGPPIIYGPPVIYNPPVYTPPPAYPPYETDVAVQVWNGRDWVTVNRRVTAYYDANSGRYYYVLDGVSHWL